MAKIVSPDRFSGGQEIATNSLVATSETLVALKSGFVDKAVAGDKIEGLSVETKTFDADNQTVKKAKLQYVRLKDETQIEIPVTAGAIAQADIGSKFDLGADGAIDATAVSPTQLYLREVLNSTKGVFVRAK
jgi:hypothetical protein